MDHVSHYPPSSPQERDLFLRIIQASLQVRRHLDLLNWLQGDLQRFLAHEVLMATWGDFAKGIVYVDVLSPLPGMRTGPVIEGDITPFLQRLFGRWKQHGSRPFELRVSDGFSLGGGRDAIRRTFRSMRTALAHGIKDERGQNDCLYIAFSSRPDIPPATASYLEVLLPHIDMALRQVLLLPGQRKEEALSAAAAANEFDLSEREMEIMRWVKAGKTNQEIGLILSISAFTVKNHLQRIFRKLDVSNRAQAVAKFAKGANAPADLP